MRVILERVTELLPGRCARRTEDLIVWRRTFTRAPLVEIDFKPSCAGARYLPGTHFYEYQALKACYGR